MNEVATEVFKIHTIESAPEGAKDHLKAANKKNGFVPNMYGVMANSPAALQSYLNAYNQFRNNSSFDAHEQEVVLLTISYHNECHYCMAAHSTIADMNDMPAAVISALRNGEELPDPKLEALRRFTRAILVKRGWPTEEDVNKFLGSGFTRQNILDILAAIAAKTISNYSNHMAQTPVDKPFQKYEWSKQ